MSEISFYKCNICGRKSESQFDRRIKIVGKEWVMTLAECFGEEYSKRYQSQHQAHFCPDCKILAETLFKEVTEQLKDEKLCIERKYGDFNETGE